MNRLKNGRINHMNHFVLDDENLVDTQEDDTHYVELYSYQDDPERDAREMFEDKLDMYRREY